jgi:hypothetical protein
MIFLMREHFNNLMGTAQNPIHHESTIAITTPLDIGQSHKNRIRRVMNVADEEQEKIEHVDEGGHDQAEDSGPRRSERLRRPLGDEQRRVEALRRSERLLNNRSTLDLLARCCLSDQGHQPNEKN